MCALKEAFSFQFKNDMTASYLVAVDINEEYICRYQAEMMLRNNIPGLLPFNFSNVDGKLEFYYDITSKLTLKDFFNHRTGVYEFSAVLKSLCASLSACRGYLLSTSGFVFHPELIFVNPSTLNTYMAYLPIRNGDNGIDEFREFVTKLALNSAGAAVHLPESYLQSILGYLKKETFSTSEFIKFLRELPGCGAEEVEDKKDAVVQDSCLEHIRPEALKFKDRSRIAAVVCSQLLPAGIIAFCLLRTDLLPAGNTSTYVGMGIIAAALDVIFLRHILSKKVKTKKMNSAAKGKTPHELKGKKNMDKSIENMKSQNTNSFTWKKDQGDTVLLGCTSVGYPYLRYIKDGLVEEVTVNKPEFVIGRMQDRVDYCLESNAVGKVHAVITGKGNEHFVKDMNSRNGTFLNGIRLESNREYGIKNNDRITLANRDYLFTVP